MQSPDSPVVPAAALRTGLYADSLVEDALAGRESAIVTTLSLSGHWQQLQCLGSAMHKCFNLIELDLSRNGLVSLHGLQPLRKLRRLNLYYNVIGKLPELDRLRHQPELEVLDLRLNPVTHAGRRHRLRAIAAAPSIRSLDGRDVTGAERARAEQLKLAAQGDDEAEAEFEEWEEDGDEEHEKVASVEDGSAEVKNAGVLAAGTVGTEAGFKSPVAPHAAMAAAWSAEQEAREAMVLAETLSAGESPTRATALPMVREVEAEVEAVAEAEAMVAPEAAAELATEVPLEEAAEAHPEAKAVMEEEVAECRAPPGSLAHLNDMTPTSRARLAESARAAMRVAVDEAFGAEISALLLPPIDRAPEQGPAVDAELNSDMGGQLGQPADVLPLDEEVAPRAGGVGAPVEDDLFSSEPPRLLPTSIPLLPTAAEAAAVGPSMAMAVAAAEERWGVERLRLEAELATLQEQKERDAEALRQSGLLVSMLQETHAALIASNEHLLAENAALKSQHAREAQAFQRNFDELAAELARQRAVAALPIAARASASGAAAVGDLAVPKKAAAAAAHAGLQKRVPGVKGKENCVDPGRGRETGA